MWYTFANLTYGYGGGRGRRRGRLGGIAIWSRPRFLGDGENAVSAAQQWSNISCILGARINHFKLPLQLLLYLGKCCFRSYFMLLRVIIPWSLLITHPFPLNSGISLKQAPYFANERNGSCCKLSSFSRQTAFWLRDCSGGGTCVKAHVRPIRGEGRIYIDFHVWTPHVF